MEMSRTHTHSPSLRSAPSLFFFAPIHALSCPRSHDNAYIIKALFLFVPPLPHPAVLPHPRLSMNPAHVLFFLVRVAGLM